MSFDAKRARPLKITLNLLLDRSISTPALREILGDIQRMSSLPCRDARRRGRRGTSVLQALHVRVGPRRQNLDPHPHRGSVLRPAGVRDPLSHEVVGSRRSSARARGLPGPGASKDFRLLGQPTGQLGDHPPRTDPGHNPHAADTQLRRRLPRLRTASARLATGFGPCGSITSPPPSSAQQGHSCAGDRPIAGPLSSTGRTPVPGTVTWQLAVSRWRRACQTAHLSPTVSS